MVSLEAGAKEVEVVQLDRDDEAVVEVMEMVVEEKEKVAEEMEKVAEEMETVAVV